MNGEEGMLNKEKDGEMYGKFHLKMKKKCGKENNTFAYICRKEILMTPPSETIHTMMKLMRQDYNCVAI